MPRRDEGSRREGGKKNYRDQLYLLINSKTNQKLAEGAGEKWDIPVCFSNWKNPKGIVVPLEKRTRKKKGLL